MDKIICLVGESGSGKTTICKALEKEGYNVIKSYTTREPRTTNEYVHIFLDDMKDFNEATKEGMIAYTYFDGAHYLATKEQYQNKGVSLYTIDVQGIETLKRIVKDAEILVIYLKTDVSIRYDRLFDRYKDGDKAINRIEHDTEAFKLIECNYVVDTNRALEEVLVDIRGVIKGE